jgi:gliding motility-associated-like protein
MSMKGFIGLIIFILLFGGYALAQPDCQNADYACTLPAFTVNSNGPGAVVDIPPGSNVSNPSFNPGTAGNSGCLLSNELNPTWIIITVSSPGQLEFTIGSAGSFGFFDWAMWPYYDNANGNACQHIQNNTLPPVACNWNGSSSGFTGMAAQGNLPPGASQWNFEHALNVQPGDQFVLCFSNFSGLVGTQVPLFFGSDIAGNNNPNSASVTCTPSITDQVICEGGTANVLIGTGGMAYTNFTWLVTDGVADPFGGPANQITPSQTTTYSVLLQGTGLPDTTISFTITLVAPPTPNAGNDAFVCGTGPHILNGIPSDPTNSVSWSFIGPSGTPAPPNAVFSPNNSTISPSVQVNYLGQYQFVFSENNGICPPVTDVVVVNFGSLPQTLAKVDPSCNGACDGTITSNAPDADEWQLNGGPWQNSPVFSGLCAGNYTVTARNALGCTANNTIALVNPAPVVVTTSPNQVICINGTTTLTATATGGTSYEFHWSHTNDLSGTQVVTPDAGLTTYSVYAVNQNGCQSTTSQVTISWHPPLSGSISVNDTVCPTQSGTLFVSTISGGNGGPYTIQWFDAVGNLLATGNVLNHVIYSSGVYTAVITDNCTTPPLILTSSIIAGQVPGVSFMVDEPEQCQTGVFTYTNLTDPAISAELYWKFGNGLSYQNVTTVTFEEDSPGSYYAQLIVVSPEGCRDTLRLNNHFTVHENPIAKFIWTPFNPKVSYPEANFFDNSYLGDYYSWTFEQGNPAVSNEQNPVVMFPNEKADEYLVTLTVTTEFGCSDSIANLIKIVPDIVLYVPNAFTPDGDKFNETWRVYIDGIDIYNFDLFIYNRWGEIVWESHNPEAEWDGTYGGMPVPEGAYIWTIKCADYTTDEKFEFKGHFTVLR